MKNSLRDMYNSVSRKHLQIYVDEFVFRFNTRQMKLKAEFAEPELEKVKNITDEYFS